MTTMQRYTTQLKQEQIIALVSERKAMLESIKSKISRKLYFAMEEKISSEQKNLQEILDWQEGKLSNLLRYTLVLDSHYFEQEFL